MRPRDLVLALLLLASTDAGADGAVVRIAITLAAAGQGEGPLVSVSSESGNGSEGLDVKSTEQTALIHADLRRPQASQPCGSIEIPVTRAHKPGHAAGRSRLGGATRYFVEAGASNRGPADAYFAGSGPAYCAGCGTGSILNRSAGLNGTAPAGAMGWVKKLPHGP
jgi:hypothetical protein